MKMRSMAGAIQKSPAPPQVNNHPTLLQVLWNPPH